MMSTIILVNNEKDISDIQMCGLKDFCELYGFKIKE